MRLFIIAILTLAFLAPAAVAITVDGYENYREKIKDYRQEEQHYRDNAEFCDRKLDETDWWNVFGKARWGIEKWSNSSKANEADRNEKFWQEQLNQELDAEKRRREAEAKKHAEEVKDAKADLATLNEKIKDLREEEKYYDKNADFCEGKREECAWWNVPGKIRWLVEENSNENKADDARDKRREYEKERAGEREELREEQDDYAFRKRLDELKDKAMKSGKQSDEDYYKMMDAAYDYYKMKEKYEETANWSLFGGVLPKIYYKIRLNHALNEAQEAQKKVYPELYGEKAKESTKVNDLNAKLRNKGIKK